MTAAMPQEQTVLHALRCTGHCGVPRIAATTGLGESVVESVLIDLGGQGFVTRQFGVWGLTEAGRDADARLAVRALADPGVAEAIRAAYERFLVLNPELLDLCTAWQLRPVGDSTVVNDHRDAAYDALVLGRFVKLDERVGPVIASLAAALPRFGRYRSRLAGALDLARGGDRDYVADNTGSYHGVWAELHEDLLATLGIHRWR